MVIFEMLKPCNCSRCCRLYLCLFWWRIGKRPGHPRTLIQHGYNCSDMLGSQNPRWECIKQWQQIWMCLFFYGNLRVPSQYHPRQANRALYNKALLGDDGGLESLNKALFLGGLQLEGIMLDSHNCCVWESQLNHQVGALLVPSTELAIWLFSGRLGGKVRAFGLQS